MPSVVANVGQLAERNTAVAERDAALAERNLFELKESATATPQVRLRTSWLSSCYTAEIPAPARDIGLVPCTTPIGSPQSNGTAGG
jgi:hypothetical protein